MQIKKKVSYTFSEATKARILELAEHYECSATGAIETIIKETHERIFGKPTPPKKPKR